MLDAKFLGGADAGDPFEVRGARFEITHRDKKNESGEAERRWDFHLLEGLVV